MTNARARSDWIYDVSACLLRDGKIAFAIAKERITREKQAESTNQHGEGARRVGVRR